MELKVLSGEDEQAVIQKKNELLDGLGYVTVDCGEEPDGLLDLVRTRSLFAPKRFIWATSFETLTDEQVKLIIDAGDDVDALVVARSITLTPKTRAVLKGCADIFNYPTPKGKGVSIRISEMIKESGLRLSSEARKELFEKAGHDTNKIFSIISQCKILDIMSPTVAQVSMLIGTSAAPGVPWGLSDAIEEGRTSEILKVTSDLSPIPAAAYLSSRYLQVGLVTECQTEEQVEHALKGMHPFQAGKIKKVANTLGPEGAAAAVRMLAAFDLRAKTSKQPQAEFDLLALSLCALFKEKIKK